MLYFSSLKPVGKGLQSISAVHGCGVEALPMHPSYAASSSADCTAF